MTNVRPVRLIPIRGLVPICPSSGHVAQRLIQICPKVFDCLNTHAQPQQRWRQVLLSRNAGPPFDGGLDCAQAGGVLDELHSGAYGVGGRGVATHVERDNRAEALELAFRCLMSRVARQAGIARQSDVWMVRKALGQRHRVALRTLQSQRQRPSVVRRNS
jgi:hypothetical protein